MSRIISLRDADRRRTKSSKKYAVAAPTIMDDDSDFSDADDECSSSDEFQLVWSDTDSEAGDSGVNGSSVDTDCSGELEDIEDYFDSLLFQNPQKVTCEGSKAQEPDPPVLKLNLSGSSGMIVRGGANNPLADKQIIEENLLVAMNESIYPHDCTTVSQQADSGLGKRDDSDWTFVSTCTSDSWAVEIFSTEDDHVDKEEGGSQSLKPVTHDTKLLFHHSPLKPVVNRPGELLSHFDPM
ncbi:hypothetical protein PG990_006117 [Apiospora arundinis]